VVGKVLRKGVEKPYKQLENVKIKSSMINGNIVEVTYIKLRDGGIKVSNAWVRKV
jgi:hypothetical protein